MSLCRACMQDDDEIDRLRARVAEVEAERDDALRLRAIANACNDQAQQLNQTLREREDELRAEVDRLTAELAALRERVGAAESGEVTCIDCQLPDNCPGFRDCPKIVAKAVGP